MALVVAVVARKGGQGKTSLAASLAAVSVSKALHTAAVDLDSQGNLSRWALGGDVLGTLAKATSVAALQFPPDDLLAHDCKAYREVRTREELVELALRTCAHTSEHVRGLAVIPAAQHIHAETAEELVVSRLPYPLVVVDTPPDVSTYGVRSILAQADVIVSPVVCEPWAVDAMGSLMRELVSVGRTDIIAEKRVRFVVNMRQKCALHDKLEEVIRGHYPDNVSRTVIPRSVAHAELSLDPRVLTKKHPMWKSAVALWAEIHKANSRRVAA